MILMKTMFNLFLFLYFLVEGNNHKQSLWARIQNMIDES
jgi:hypothetical protein